MLPKDIDDKDIILNPLDLSDNEPPKLRKLIDIAEEKVTNPNNVTVKIRKSRGKKKDAEGKFIDRIGEGYSKKNDKEFFHLENYSLIKFPKSDRYYVVGDILGEGV